MSRMFVVHDAQDAGVLKSLKSAIFLFCANVVLLQLHLGLNFIDYRR